MKPGTLFVLVCVLVAAIGATWFVSRRSATPPPAEPQSPATPAPKPAAPPTALAQPATTEAPRDPHASAARTALPQAPVPTATDVGVMTSADPGAPASLDLATSPGDEQYEAKYRDMSNDDRKAVLARLSSLLAGYQAQAGGDKEYAHELQNLKQETDWLARHVQL